MFNNNRPLDNTHPFPTFNTTADLRMKDDAFMQREVRIWHHTVISLSWFIRSLLYAQLGRAQSGVYPFTP